MATKLLPKAKSPTLCYMFRINEIWLTESEHKGLPFFRGPFRNGGFPFGAPFTPPPPPPPAKRMHAISTSWTRPSEFFRWVGRFRSRPSTMRRGPKRALGSSPKTEDVLGRANLRWGIWVSISNHRKKKQILVDVSIYQGSILGTFLFDPQSYY